MYVVTKISNGRAASISSSGNTSTIQWHNAEHRNTNFDQCGNLQLQSVPRFWTYKLDLARKYKRLELEICRNVSY